MPGGIIKFGFLFCESNFTRILFKILCNQRWSEISLRPQSDLIQDKIALQLRSLQQQQREEDKQDLVFFLSRRVRRSEDVKRPLPGVLDTDAGPSWAAAGASVINCFFVGALIGAGFGQLERRWKESILQSHFHDFPMISIHFHYIPPRNPWFDPPFPTKLPHIQAKLADTERQLQTEQNTRIEEQHRNETPGSWVHIPWQKTKKASEWKRTATWIDGLTLWFKMV